MTTLALAPTLLDPVGGMPTLDELLVDAWEGIAAGRVVQCPVCDRGMRSDPGDQSDSVGAAGSLSGRCSSCESELS